MTKNLKEGDKVVLIGTLLGNIITVEAGEVVALGVGDVPTGEVLRVKLECGNIVAVPAQHVHLPS